MTHRKHRSAEQSIQRAVFQHLSTRGVPGVFAFAVPNGGYRKPIEAAILKGQGVKKGVPDIFAVHDGKCFAIELKTPSGRLADDQRGAIQSLRDAGANVAVCYGLDQALNILEGWGLLRGQSQCGEFQSIGSVASRVVQKLEGQRTQDDSPR